MSGKVTLAAQTPASAFREQLNEIRSTFSKVLNNSVSGGLQTGGDPAMVSQQGSEWRTSN